MEAPTQVGSYELGLRLGAGGMAETFVGVRRGPGGFEQRVCVKRILPRFEDDALFVAQFLEEARVSARLRHTHVVQVLDFGVADGSHYLVLELVEGADLARLVDALEERGERLAPSVVAFVAQQLAIALDYAHAHPEGAVFHRDVSPSNVLVSRAGEIKLSDFGIAKAAIQPEGAPKTRTGVIKGKIPYLAAEYQLTGRFDARSDLFALGVLLYECLAGRRPYVGVTDLDTCHRIITGQHPPLAELRPDAPAELVAIVERLLRPEPDERPPSAAALLDALAEIAPPPTERRRLAELVRSVEVEPAPEVPRRESDVTLTADVPTRADSRVQTTTRSPARGVAVASAVLALALAALATFALASPRAGAPAPESTTPQAAAPSRPAIELAASEPPRAPPAPDDPIPTTEAPTVEPAAPSRARGRRTPPASTAHGTPHAPAPVEDAPARSGTLRVTVAPWGVVWIDGRYMGRAPVDAVLEPGSHRVEAGFERPLVSQTVRIGAGETERVFIELTQPAPDP